MKSSRSRSIRRRAVATVEFAIAAPVLALLIFGSIEASQSIQLKQGLTITAYEAAMVATSQSANASKMETRTREIAAAFHIRDLRVTTVPAIVPELLPGTLVTVTVSAPVSSNRVGPNFFYADKVLTVTAAMTRL